jgi:predicted ATPase
LFNEMRRDAQALKGNSEELMRLASEKGMQGWLAGGIWHRGQAVAMLGQVQEGMAQMREGMAAFQSRGVRASLSRTLCSLAEAQAKAGHPEEGLDTLAEAFAFVEKTGERHWEAELYRLKGELLLMQGDDAGAEASLHQAESRFQHAESCFQHAIEVARRQSAKSWELRAVMSLSRLWQKQGKTDEARQMLTEIYGSFTEGFDTADLKEAKVLLISLS